MVSWLSLQRSAALVVKRHGQPRFTAAVEAEQSFAVGTALLRCCSCSGTTFTVLTGTACVQYVSHQFCFPSIPSYQVGAWPTTLFSSKYMSVRIYQLCTCRHQYMYPRPSWEPRVRPQVSGTCELWICQGAGVAGSSRIVDAYCCSNPPLKFSQFFFLDSHCLRNFRKKFGIAAAHYFTCIFFEALAISWDIAWTRCRIFHLWVNSWFRIKGDVHLHAPSHSRTKLRKRHTDLETAHRVLYLLSQL